MGPMDVFDQGRFAVAADPAGAVFSLWQPRAFMGAGLLDAPGALGWAELLNPDPEGALAFYTAVFGWTVDATERYTHWGVDGAEFGGMKALDGEEEPQTPPRWVPYFTVVDVEIAAATALGAGRPAARAAEAHPGRTVRRRAQRSAGGRLRRPRPLSRSWVSRTPYARCAAGPVGRMEGHLRRTGGRSEREAHGERGLSRIRAPTAQGPGRGAPDRGPPGRGLSRSRVRPA